MAVGWDQRAEQARPTIIGRKADSLTWSQNGRRVCEANPTGKMVRYARRRLLGVTFAPGKPVRVTHHFAGNSVLHAPYGYLCKVVVGGPALASSLVPPYNLVPRSRAYGDRNGYNTAGTRTFSGFFQVAAMIPQTLKCYLVQRDNSGNVTARVTERKLDELPQGNVLVRVAFSSLNYKDALAATGHQGVVRRFPHVPGVDVAGTVAASDAQEYAPGDQVIVTGFDVGATRWGGWAEFIRVPHEWIVPLPQGLSLREAMIIGTAGLTAAFCVDALQKHDVQADSGPVVVTGATGGVGSMAVAILGKLGYEVAAVTGKTEAHEYLKRLGADADPRPRRGQRPQRPALALRALGGRHRYRGREYPGNAACVRCGTAVAWPPAGWPAATNCR